MSKNFQFDVRRSNTADLIAERARDSADKTFLHYLPDGQRISYLDLDQRTNGIGTALVAAGTAAGTHVALLLDNCPELVLSIFSISKIGAVWVPINTAARGKLLRYYLDLADIEVMVIHSDYAQNLRQVLEHLPKLRTVFVVGDHAQVQKSLGDAVGVHLLPGPDAATREKPPVSGGQFSDLSCLLFTSGTTGPSKAVMMAQGTVHFYAAHNAHYRDVREDDIEYVCMPMFHANALLNSVMSSFMARATIAMTDRYSTTRFWDEIRASNATRFNTLGAIANFLWTHPPHPRDRDNKVRLCSLAPVPKFVHEFEQRFGLKVFTGYGLSDYCLATSTAPDDPPEKIFTCGRPRAGIEVRIVDDDDFDVPTGTPGEIILRSNHMWGTSSGYYKMPEATVESRRNLWLHTGDRGYLDADGYLCFTDRKKDAIRRRGENISAYEVESVIVTHPAVLQCAVYPLRAELPEDEVAVSVVLRPGMTLSHAELIAYCVANMSYFMVPRFIQMTDELPLTPTGKVEKYKLKDVAQGNRAALWDRESAGIEVASPRSTRQRGQSQ